MVIGEKDNTTAQSNAVTQNAAPPSSIDNIMSGISNTGSVKMNNHRKKLRQRYERKPLALYQLTYIDFVVFTISFVFFPLTDSI